MSSIVCIEKMIYVGNLGLLSQVMISPSFGLARPDIYDREGIRIFSNMIENMHGMVISVEFIVGEMY